MMYSDPPSPAKYQCALQLRGPGQAPLCLSLSYFSLEISQKQDPLPISADRHWQRGGGGWCWKEVNLFMCDLFVYIGPVHQSAKVRED